LSKKLSL